MLEIYTIADRRLLQQGVANIMASKYAFFLRFILKVSVVFIIHTLKDDTLVWGAQIFYKPWAHINAVDTK